jgi:hypothetical protein
MPGARCTRGLVCKTVQKHTRAYRYRRGHPGIPCAMALRLIPRSPRRRIRLVTVADGLKDCLDPVGSTRLRQLDTSNGCQDHTASPYAASPVVCTLCSLTDKARPANTTTRPTLPRPPQPVPTFVTMANAPLPGRDGGRCRFDLGKSGREIFSHAELDRWHHVEFVVENQFPAHVTMRPAGIDNAIKPARVKNANPIWFDFNPQGAGVSAYSLKYRASLARSICSSM